ncbi:hypothetical protein GCM10020358_41080 [Amorphoplanes nipponensis]|uniref:Carbohydrate kinase PfkB domain-containing protein n=1 Tax=Actinoplanes nipponensis TaxID=135950 RepID=A0A919JE60_9ACTN|nr:PfkB family carbohydrate kinase [Actinoplanes nipponensis]GIE47700.1 hypothetical protein Ani05nite_12340 [Actinoplanes nipponensis]
MTTPTAAVVGQLTPDLALSVDELPEPGSSAGDGNLFGWAGGHLHLPLTGAKVVDTTGGGDAFVAAPTASLLRGDPYPEAARRATAASGATVSHAGGRPDLTGPAARG